MVISLSGIVILALIVATIVIGSKVRENSRKIQELEGGPGEKD
jgi:hypothetical protein